MFELWFKKKEIMNSLSRVSCPTELLTVLYSLNQKIPNHFYPKPNHSPYSFPSLSLVVEMVQIRDGRTGQRTADGCSIGRDNEDGWSDRCDLQWIFEFSKTKYQSIPHLEPRFWVSKIPALFEKYSYDTSNESLSLNKL